MRTALDIPEEEPEETAPQRLYRLMQQVTTSSAQAAASFQVLVTDLSEALGGAVDDRSPIRTTAWIEKPKEIES